MKGFSSIVGLVMQGRGSHRSVKMLLKFLFLLCLIIILNSILFRGIMHLEQRDYSWIAALYWTITTMSTLGFGDIVFTSDIGRVFSIVVMLSGLVLLVVLLPFTFIQFFYAPFMEAQMAARAPRKLPPDTNGHVILTHFDPISQNLIRRLSQYKYNYVLLAPEPNEALRLYDQGYTVVVGDLDNPETYENICANAAALVATTSTDQVNTNVAFTVRGICRNVPIIATADHTAAAGIIERAGATHVLHVHEMTGRFLARRTHAGGGAAHIVGRFDELVIAEATVAGTSLAGRTLAASRLRETAGITAVGVWERGRYEPAWPNTIIDDHSVLLIAGSKDQIEKFNARYSARERARAPVLIIGAGRVGRATARALHEQGIQYRILEKDTDALIGIESALIGDAARIEDLESAGVREAPSVIITTRDDDVNIYLTIYLRQLRPDVQILTRSTRERNVATLHRAGADFVVSYASMGANTIFNLLKRSDILMVAEGLSVFRVATPRALVGKSLVESAVRRETGCSVIAIQTDGKLSINPDPRIPLERGAELILIGGVDAQSAFLKTYIKKGDAQLPTG